MNKIVITLAALAACVSLRAQEPASSYSVTVDFPYTSKYVFRGNQLASDSFQPSVEVASGNWYAGLWTNLPIERVDKSLVENEIDFYAGYGIPLSDTWSIDTGVTYYYYPEKTAGSGIEDTTEFFVGLTGTLAGFTPSFYSYYDIDRKAWTFQAAAGYSVSLSDKASLDFSATLGRVDTDGGSDYTYYGAGAVLPYKLNDSATLNFGVQWATTNFDDADDEIWATTGITIGF